MTIWELTPDNTALVRNSIDIPMEDMLSTLKDAEKLKSEVLELLTTLKHNLGAELPIARDIRLKVSDMLVPPNPDGVPVELGGIHTWRGRLFKVCEREDKFGCQLCAARVIDDLCCSFDCAPTSGHELQLEEIKE